MKQIEYRECLEAGEITSGVQRDWYGLRLKKKSQSSSRTARSYSTLWGKEWAMRLKRLIGSVEDTKYWDKTWSHPSASGRYICVCVCVCECVYIQLPVKGFWGQNISRTVCFRTIQLLSGWRWFRVGVGWGTGGVLTWPRVGAARRGRRWPRLMRVDESYQQEGWLAGIRVRENSKMTWILNQRLGEQQPHYCSVVS